MFMYIHVHKVQALLLFTIRGSQFRIHTDLRTWIWFRIAPYHYVMIYSPIPLQMTLPSHHHLLFGHLSDTTSKQLYNDFVLRHAVITVWSSVRVISLTHWAPTSSALSQWQRSTTHPKPLPSGPAQPPAPSSHAAQENSSSAITFFQEFRYNRFPNVLILKKPGSKLKEAKRHLITWRWETEDVPLVLSPAEK